MSNLSHFRGLSKAFAIIWLADSRQHTTPPPSRTQHKNKEAGSSEGGVSRHNRKKEQPKRRGTKGTLVSLRHITLLLLLPLRNHIQQWTGTQFFFYFSFAPCYLCASKAHKNYHHLAWYPSFYFPPYHCRITSKRTRRRIWKGIYLPAPIHLFRNHQRALP